MTMTDAATAVNPRTHPIWGPNARAVQMNVSPQSGSARFM